jgi:hypothetical protein
MAKNYKIQFVSLRAGTTYVLNIGGGSGNAVQLNGGAEPFTTEEDGNEDMFTNIRTQTGYFRIIDNAKDYNGNVIDATAGQDWWKDLIPATDSDRPVTLTVGNTVVWQGFMQSQTFSGQLYGNPQEREFPVICPLGVLAGVDIDFNAGLKNFAYLLKNVCDTIDLKSNNVVHISDIYVQGGDDARQWLLTKTDWQNFASEGSDGVARAKYTIYDVLEDMCRFWGWTARTKGTALYLTCADDSAEQNFLKLNRTQLNTLASATTDTTTGSIAPPTTVTLQDTAADPIFASTNQENYQIQGPHRAVVKADVSPVSDVMEFAPQTVRNQMEAGGYTWVGDGNIGYFTTPAIYSFTSARLDGSSNSYGGFVRRQIYGTADAESANICDMILHKRYSNGSTPIAQLRTKRPMPFGSGTLKLSGSIYAGAESLTTDEPGRSFNVRIGIGLTYETAKWLKFSRTVGDHSDASWEDTKYEVKLAVKYAPKLCLMAWDNSAEVVTGWLQAVPLKTPRSGGGLYGYLFIDFMGTEDRADVRLPEQFELANFRVEYSRDEEIIASGGLSRKITKDRVDSQEYTATNSNSSKDEWNANCIFASDNNMEYGYGLLLDANGYILQTVQYGGSATNQQHPEQHLATRVANYWATAKRKIDGELLANKIGDISPNMKVSITGESGTFAPIAISRDWRDDITRLSLLQL